VSPFNRMLEKYDGTWLHNIHRQSEDSNIISNGHKILQGLMPSRKDDFVMKITDEPVRCIEELVMDSTHDDLNVDFGSIDTQIITSTNLGWTGTTALNASVQGMLQPSSTMSMELDRHKWDKKKGPKALRVMIGDKVIQNKNQYSLDPPIFNGETGIITAFDSAGGIVIDFGDKEGVIPTLLEMSGKEGTFYINPQKDLTLAYVITTHKAQGSEYDEVFYVINKSRPFQLNKKNFYTAVSRAKKKVTVITDQRALQLSLYKSGED